MRIDSTEAMLNAYRSELTQLTYTPEYAAHQRKRIKAVTKQKKKNKLSDDALLRKLEGYTAPEETAPVPAKGSRRR